MSFLNPGFPGIISGLSTPYDGFGDQCEDLKIANERFALTADEATNRIGEVFQIDFSCGLESVSALDRLVDQMWIEKWTPLDSNIDLFATDFGSVFMCQIIQSFSGISIFRSRIDLTHTSLWWPIVMIELFPFHIAYDRLRLKESRSFSSYILQLQSALNLV